MAFTKSPSLVSLFLTLLVLTHCKPLSTPAPSLQITDDPDQTIHVDCFRTEAEPAADLIDTTRAPTYHDCWETADIIQSYDHLGMVVFVSNSLGLENETIITSAYQDSTNSDHIVSANDAGLGATEKRAEERPSNFRHSLPTPFNVVHETCRARITLQNPYKQYEASFAWIAKRAWMMLDDCVHSGEKKGGTSHVGGGLEIQMGYNPYHKEKDFVG